MKIALAQMNSTTGDLSGNYKKILDFVKRSKDSDIIAFPEMSLPGYCISDLVEDELFIKRNKELIYEMAKVTSGIKVAIIVGFIDYDLSKKNQDGRLRKYNAAALIQNGRVLGIIHKTLLPNYRYFDDKRYFTSGEKRTVYQINTSGGEVKIGISICEDMWDDDYEIKPIEELSRAGAQVLININASPFVPQKVLRRQELIRRHVEKTRKPLVYVNTVGAADNGKNIIPFDGESLAYNSRGKIIGIGKKFEEDLVIVNTESDEEFTPLHAEREAEIYQALVMSVKDYAHQAGFNKAILPLSGGIDSALGLAITVDALGKDNVIAYNLPSKFNTSTTKDLARTIASNLGVDYKIIPIQEIDDKIKNVFEESAHHIRDKIARENLHARIRGVIMMLESNDTSALLISNGNKTEIALGYSTLYGDMCGGISVIGDLSKVDVYKVSHYVNKRHGREIIPQATFTIKPSAELSDGQYDPFDYPVVSPLVDLFINDRKSASQIISMYDDKEIKFTPDFYQRYDRSTFEKLVFDTFKSIRRSVYKRLQGPPIISVSQRSFGFDLRETIINKWDGK
jgi:NAD+ synthase (glutamine-hydrolysing)